MRKVSINGVWNFTKEDAFGKNASWETVTVPHTWNGIDGQDGGNDYHRGLCFYSRTIEIEDTDEKVYLEFEGVNSVGTVYVNGTELGTHKGGYSTFRYDVTDYVKPGENELLVGVDNTHDETVYPLMADFTFYGGIYRDAYIVYSNKISFDLNHVGAPGVYVSQKDISKEVAKFGVEAYIDNASVPKEVKVKVELLNGKVVELTSEKSLQVKESGLVEFDLELENPRLWNGRKDPFLYDVKVLLIADNSIVDERTIPTGFRFFKFDENKFFLNGEELMLNGVSRHQDRVDVGNALTKEMHDEDMELIKEVGANSIRLAHYQQAQYFYDLCDKEGMVIWAEIPYISVTSKTDETGSNAISQMEELVKQNYNHSSIFMWGIQNEIEIQGIVRNIEGILKELNSLTKKWDPYRVTTQAHVTMHPVTQNTHEISDINAYNKYYGWYMGETSEFQDFLDEWRTEYPNRPIGISEYGAEGIIMYHSDEPKMKDYSEEYHAIFHEEVYKIISECPFVWGTYVWNMFTFAADSRDEGGVKGLNNKGLVSFDRKIRKDAFFYYKAKWNEEPMLHLNSKRFHDRHNKDIQLKAYSNQGTVEFYLNGTLVDTVTSDDVIFTTKVTLKEGMNTVKVVSNGLIDSTSFVTVEEMNPEYIVPSAEQDKGVFSFGDAGNWFDDLVDDVGEITYNEGFYSIKDPIQEILKSEEGLELFKKAMPGFIEHPMFEMAQGFSVEMITQFDKNAIPEGLVKVLSAELQKIKK